MEGVWLLFQALEDILRILFYGLSTIAMDKLYEMFALSITNEEMHTKQC